MAKKASNKVSVKLGTTKHTFRFSVVDLSNWSMEQLQEVARNGYMGRVRAFIKSQVQDIDIAVKKWDDMLARYEKVPKNKRPADAEGAMAMMKAMHFGETPEEMPESFDDLTPEQLLGVEDDETETEEENGDEAEG